MHKHTPGVPSKSLGKIINLEYVTYDEIDLHAYKEISKSKFKKLLNINAIRPTYANDLLDKVFNNLTVIKYLGAAKSHAIWLVYCSYCNKYSVQFGYSVIARIKENVHRCEKCKNVKHNESRTLFYRQWSRMLVKCYNEKSIGYKYFGALDIEVKPEWLDYINFRNDMYNSYENKATLKLMDGCKEFNDITVYWQLN